MFTKVYEKALDTVHPFVKDADKTLKRDMSKMIGLPVDQIDLRRHKFPKNDEHDKQTEQSLAVV